MPEDIPGDQDAQIRKLKEKLAKQLALNKELQDKFDELSTLVKQRYG